MLMARRPVKKSVIPINSLKKAPDSEETLRELLKNIKQSAQAAERLLEISLEKSRKAGE